MCPTLGPFDQQAARGSPADRRRRVTHRAVPLIAIAAVALIVGIVVGAGRESDAERTADSFTRAWARSDYPAMYRLLTSGARDRTSLAAFERAYRMAGATATAVSLRAGRA